MSFGRATLEALVRNPVFANLAAASFVIVGFLVASGLPRETFPETATDFILVTVPYPGASPEDAEQGVCLKVEQAVEGLWGVGEVSALAEENSGKILCEVLTRVRPTADVLRDIEDRVNSITTFPKETEKPIISELIVRNHVISIGISGDLPEETIKRVAERIRRDLLNYRSISQVSISGVREYEISVQLSERAMRRYGLSFQEVMDAIATGSLDLPAGTIRSSYEEINVRTVEQRYTAQEFEDLVVIARPDGTTVRLGQVAEVYDRFEEAPLFGRVNGRPGAKINVAKTATEDTSAIAAIVRRYVQEVQPNLPEGVQLSIWADASRDVDGRLAMLVENGIFGMGLVLISLLIFLDLRSSLAVALGIPVSFAGALAVTGWTGNTLNMISLLGLLMLTGIIVDDSIVVAESVRERRRRGLVPALAAVEGTRRVALPVLLSSITTIIAFIPLMFVEGVMGKLIFVLPVVVIAGIFASGVEAFLILPSHLAEWGTGDESRIARWRTRLRNGIDTRVDWFIDGPYARWLEKALCYRGVVFSGTLAIVLICAGLVLSGRTPFVLFPKIDGNTLLARVRLPDGVPVSLAEETVQRMEAAARSLNEDPELRPAGDGPLVRQVYAAVGQWEDYVPRLGSHLCEVSIELMPAELRRVDSGKIIDRWREAIGPVPDAFSFTIVRQELGPTEKPIEVRLLGDDLLELRRAADDLKAKLATYEGVFDIEDDLIPGKRELRVTLKPGATTLGITAAELAAQLRQGLHGGEALRLQRGPDEIKVMVSYAGPDRQSISSVENMRVRTVSGAEIPFEEVAETQLVRGYSGISRQDGTRRVRIFADLDEGRANAEQIVQDLLGGFLPDLDRKYPGVTYAIEGQRARIAESMTSLLWGAVIAVIVMYAVISLPLKSYIQPMVIMTAVPLGFVGAVFGHAIMGYELTLMSVFGLMALAGVVVNDSLVLVDRINENIGTGMGVFEAAADAGRSRFRAVVLTTLTTVAGLMPLVLERSSQAQSLIPMCISLAFGELFGTVLTLFVVPVMFLLANDLKRLGVWLWRGGALPAAEDVEQRGRELGLVEAGRAVGAK